MNWIKLTENNYPEPKEIVFVCAWMGINNDIPYFLRAVYYPENYKEDEDYESEFQGDLCYDEENDKYFWPEGWYEWNYNDECHWRINQKITHYCIPESSKDK